jgi:hypothetical protein
VYVKKIKQSRLEKNIKEKYTMKYTKIKSKYKKYTNRSAKIPH